MRPIELRIVSFDSLCLKFLKIMQDRLIIALNAILNLGVN